MERDGLFGVARGNQGDWGIPAAPAATSEQSHQRAEPQTRSGFIRGTGS